MGEGKEFYLHKGFCSNLAISHRNGRLYLETLINSNKLISTYLSSSPSDMIGEFHMFTIHCTTKNHNLEEELKVTIFLKSFLNNFPAALFGKELTNVTRLIFLYGATCNQEKSPN